MRLILICAIVSVKFGYAQDLFQNVEYGHYSVKHYSTVVTDPDRLWDDSLTINREVQIQVWYPFTNISNKGYQYQDYFKFIGTENKYRDHDNPIGYGEKVYFYPARYFKVSENKLDSLKNFNMLASYSSTFPTGTTYPTIFFSQGASGRPINNVPLFELLASHGFVVVSYPSQAPNSNTSFVDNIPGGLKNQAVDLKMAYAYSIEHFPMVDKNNIHFAGISSGTLAQYFLIKENNLNPKSVTSFDGSILSKSMEPFFDGYQIPIFNCPVFVANRYHEGVNFNILEKLTNQKTTTFFFTNLRHADFSSGPLLYRIVNNFYGPANDGFIESYEYMISKWLYFISNGAINNSVKIDSAYLH